MLGKLLSMASIGELILGVNLTKRFVESVIVIVALAITAAVVTGSLIVFVLYVFDLSLLAHGIGFGMAALITALSGSALVLLFVAAILYRVKLLHTIPLTVSGAELAATSALRAFKSFYKGLTEKS